MPSKNIPCLTRSLLIAGHTPLISTSVCTVKIRVQKLLSRQIVSYSTGTWSHHGQARTFQSSAWKVQSNLVLKLHVLSSRRDTCLFASTEIVPFCKHRHKELQICHLQINPRLQGQEIEYWTLQVKAPWQACPLVTEAMDSVVQNENKRARVERISFCVRTSQGQVIKLVSNNETPFAKIYKAVAHKLNINEFSFRLMYDEKFVDRLKAVSEVLGVESGDNIVIDMLHHQVGCWSSCQDATIHKTASKTHLIASRLVVIDNCRTQSQRFLQPYCCRCLRHQGSYNTSASWDFGHRAFFGGLRIIADCCELICVYASYRVAVNSNCDLAQQ